MDKNRALQAAFVIAARDGQAEVVELLLEAGADVHGFGDVAVRLAAESGHDEVVQVLLEAGADAGARDAEALRKAEENGHSTMAALLKSWLAGRGGGKPPAPGRS